MSRYDQCLAVILRLEGGYVDDPTDRGGATNKGITQKTYDAYRKECGLPLRSVKEITDDEVSAIYRLKYWNTSKCPVLPEPIDLLTFDAAIQHGQGRATKFLQLALGVDQDGSFGPKSIDALQEEIHAGLLDELTHNLLAIRLQFYDDIVDAHPEQHKFLQGWQNRIDLLKRAI